MSAVPVPPASHILLGDMRDVLRDARADSFHACVCDPPYHLTAVSRNGSPRSNDQATPFGRHRLQDHGFMGKQWDGGDIAFQPETWAAVLRVLRPGAHITAFGGTRTYHRLVCAIEDAGFEIRDTICWMFGSGFVKNHDFAGWRDNVQVRQTKPEFVGHPQAEGFGTALKPACELICLARKPLSESTVAANVLRWSTGALNIDASRVPTTEPGGRPLITGDYKDTANNVYEGRMDGSLMGGSIAIGKTNIGRWPANLVHDGAPKVLEAFGRFAAPGQLAAVNGLEPSAKTADIYGSFAARNPAEPRGDSGSPARFFTSCSFTADELRLFYCPKASRSERLGSKHPTVKPLALMSWLCRLVCPPAGYILDPFCGTGSTLVAARRAGFSAIGIDNDPAAVADAEHKLAHFAAVDAAAAARAASAALGAQPRVPLRSS